MTEPQTPEDKTPEHQLRLDQLLEEASLWFARMRGPDAHAYQPEFNAWLARGAAHLGAYNRAAEIFSMGKFLAETGERLDLPDPAPPRRRSPVAFFLAGAALAAVLAIWLGAARPTLLESGGGSEVARTRDRTHAQPLLLSTGRAGGQTFALADGSRVTLDRDTRLAVAYTAGTRSLRLGQGRGRFDVAHEARPFVVYAGRGTVTAHGTVFDVAIDQRQHVKVRLLRGAIDVALPADIQSVQHLKPGQEVTFTMTAISRPATGTSPEPAMTTPVIGEFDGVTLSDLVADANRLGGRRIVLADPSLGAVRVSGRFSLTDPGKLAARLAVLQGLTVDNGDPQQITLRRR
ncbi:MAG: putative anti-sigma factor [Novosphingobium sp.]|nr:putative anti-sigma factor [Novosphingobium sp.]